MDACCTAAAAQATFDETNCLAHGPRLKDIASCRLGVSVSKSPQLCSPQAMPQPVLESQENQWESEHLGYVFPHHLFESVMFS